MVQANDHGVRYEVFSSLQHVIVTFFTTATTAQEASKCTCESIYSIDMEQEDFMQYCHITADITSSPQSMNTSLNEEAVFNCTYVAEVFGWEVNKRQINSGQDGFEFFSVPLNATRSLYKSTLTVVASPDKNSTNLTCTAYSSSPLSNKRSEIALLLVQGMFY